MILLEPFLTDSFKLILSQILLFDKKLILVAYNLYSITFAASVDQDQTTYSVLSALVSIPFPLLSKQSEKKQPWSDWNGFGSMLISVGFIHLAVKG